VGEQQEVDKLPYILTALGTLFLTMATRQFYGYLKFAREEEGMLVADFGLLPLGSSEAGKLQQIPLLFCGKTTLEDMRTLGQLVEEGLVVPPRYLPEPFADLNALSAWMCFSGFLTNLSLDRIEADYANIL